MYFLQIYYKQTQKDPEVSMLTLGLFYALNCTAHGFKFFYFSNEPYTRSTLLVRELSPYIKTRKKPQKRVNSPWGIFTHLIAPVSSDVHLLACLRQTRSFGLAPYVNRYKKSQRQVNLPLGFLHLFTHVLMLS